MPFSESGSRTGKKARATPPEAKRPTQKVAMQRDISFATSTPSRPNFL